jgi:hypothetical protein
MDEKLLALDALYSYAVAMGAAFHPAVSALVQACLPLLTYRFSDKARAGAANALAESYKCIVLAAGEGAGGVTAAHCTELLGMLLKPISEQLNKEDSLDAVDALLEAVRELVTLERTHSVGALVGPAALNGVVQLIKAQLQKDEARLKQRAEEAAEREEEEGPSDEEEAEAESEAEVLGTVGALVGELLRQYGDAAVGAIEAQLLPHVQPWLAGEETTRISLGLEIVAGVIEHATSADVRKKYVSASLPLLAQHSQSPVCRLRRAALSGLGVVAEHGGKLLTRAASTDLGNKLLATLEAADARFSSSVDASEAAVAALGKMLVHRSAALDMERTLPVWLSWLPLRISEDDARSSMLSLYKLCEADAAQVFGADGSRFPAVLGAMAAAYEAEATGEEVSRRLRSLVQSWAASNGELLRSTAAALPQPHLREKVGRMAA